MKIDNNKLIPHLWMLAVLFYLLRSIAEPVKYLFFISFGLLLINFSYFFIINYKKNGIINCLFVSKEFQILGLFLLLGIMLSQQFELLPVKSLINFLGISFFYLIYLDYKDQIQIKKVLKGWIIFTLIIGTIGLLKWLNIIFEVNWSWFSVFYKYGTSLVSEYNFYACYFIISTVIYYYALKKNFIQTKLIINQAILFLYLLNIIMSGSRRGLILLAILLLFSIYLLIVKRKKKKLLFYKNLFFLNALFYSLLLILIVLIPFRTKIINKKSTQTNIAISIYRYSTLFISNITYSLLYDRLWPQSTIYENDNTDWDEYATYNNLVEGNIKNKHRGLKNEYWLAYASEKNSTNLFYNGDFEYGLNFWGEIAPDSIKHKIIKTKYGNAIRVSRADGNGYWPLEYNGREIYYYKGVKYKFKFKYRVIKGSGMPFMIGWWVDEGEGYKHNLSKSIEKLDNEWYECTASYKFKENQTNLPTFMNTQHPNTIIDFTDIELTCDDSLNRPIYVDQLKQVKGTNLFYNSNFENGATFWTAITLDSVDHKLIETQYGKAIRVTRKKGSGYWPLAYQGRDIYYRKGLTYYFRFKFRVIKGEEAPFQIGWWLIENEQHKHNLKKNIYPLSDKWFECIASYKFKEDHYSRVITFMNSQKANTIIDFADIELICNDTLNRSMYVDENIDLLRNIEESRMKQQLEIEKDNFLSERTNRWKYTLELWQTEYQWHNKLFGQGFDYLEKFGQKFFPDEKRLDYPHNPIISSFLYSGIIGGLFYIYFLFLTFWYYWKYRKHHMVFFIMYLVTFFFVFVSSDNHFDTPIFAFLSLIPFITRYVVKEKGNKNVIEKKPE